MKIGSLIKLEKTPEYIELHGRSGMVAEGYCRIGEYSDARIRFDSASGGILLTGEELTLRHLSRGRIAVDGRIKGIEFV